MEIPNPNKLKLKTKGVTMQEKGVSEFIKELLNNIPKGHSCSLKELSKALMAEYPKIGESSKAYIRIKNVARREKIWTTLKGPDQFTHLARLEEVQEAQESNKESEVGEDDGLV